MIKDVKNFRYSHGWYYFWDCCLHNISIRIAGTVIGAIIGSMLYQLMTHFFRKPIDNVDSLRTQKVESSVFYVFPLIIILGIEILYLFSSFYHTLMFYSNLWKLQLDGTFSDYWCWTSGYGVYPP